jgi:hypothetical protein
MTLENSGINNQEVNLYQKLLEEAVAENRDSEASMAREEESAAALRERVRLLREQDPRLQAIDDVFPEVRLTPEEVEKVYLVKKLRRESIELPLDGRENYARREEIGRHIRAIDEEIEEAKNFDTEKFQGAVVQLAESMGYTGVAYDEDKYLYLDRNGFRFFARCMPIPTETGIGGVGRISRMNAELMTSDGTPLEVAFYDRGWARGRRELLHRRRLTGYWRYLTNTYYLNG